MLKSFLAHTRLHSKLSRGKYRQIMKEGKFAPPINREMKELDRSFFRKSVPLTVAYIPNPKYLGQFVKSCKKDILNLTSIKHIINIDDKRKGVLMREDIETPETASQKLSESTIKKIEEFGVNLEPYNLELDYDFWKADDILRAVLPEHLLDEIPTGFAQAGHVAHLNLRNEFKPFGKFIGQVLIDKNTKVETVVDKVDTIDTKFRTFQMNILAGRNDLLVEQSESGCKFKFDFSKVYWNSRLNTEHERLITHFKSNEVVADVFAGVGPFAVPAGKKNVLVLANDLNPESFKYLKQNINSNKVDDFVKPFNLDGRDFIRNSPSLLLKWSNESKMIEKKVKRRRIEGQENKPNFDVTHVEIPKFFSNYVMNLPDSALTFLNEFIGLYTRDPLVEETVKSIENFKLPIINVHCFEKYNADEEPSMEELHMRVLKKIQLLIDYDLKIEDCNFHLVRKVAPTKPMFCVSFTLPKEVAFKKV